ncbi:MAG TPA: hypothetical protein VKZ98_06310 [Aquaticitalea sp.]|nr:hypothetical protein [Aquaticitalea sp.]
MKVFRHAFDFYINSSIHVALAVCSMAWITLLKFDLPFDGWLLGFIFFASITGYNFVKYFGIAKFHHRSLAQWLKMIQLFSLLCFILMCYFAFHLEERTLIYIAVFALITFLYAIPFFPKDLFIDKQRNLRSIGGLKVYVIGLVWAGVTVLLPLLNQEYHYDADVWITALQRFLLVILMMLPFEIRDLQYDSLKLSTIPQKIGINNTKTMGVLLGMGFFLLEFLKDFNYPNEILISFLIALTTILLLVFARKNQQAYYSSFWVESVPVFWLFLHFIL